MKSNVVLGTDIKGLLDYTFDVDETGKEAETVSTNMSGLDIKSLAAEFQSVRSLRPDIVKAVAHHSLSLTHGESLPPEKWDEVVRSYLKKMGVDTDNHQYVATIHRDKEHEHVHIGFNRIGINGKVWLGKQSVLKAIEATQELEKEFGLTQTVGLKSSDRRNPLSKVELSRAKKSGLTPERFELASHIRDAVTASNGDFVRFNNELVARGIAMRPNGLTGSVSGAAFEYAGINYAGGRIGDTRKEFAWKTLAESVGYDAVQHASLIAELRSGSVAAAQTKADARDARAIETDYVDTLSLIRTELWSRDSAVTRDRFDELMQSVDESLPMLAERIRAEIESDLVICSEDREGETLITTQALIDRDIRMADDIGILKGMDRHTFSDGEISKAITEKERRDTIKFGAARPLTDEQRLAVGHAMRSGLSVMQGSAGAGKSFALEVLKVGYEQRQAATGEVHRVIGAAESKKAAAGLQADTGIESFTIAKLLSDLDKGKVVLDRNSAIVVDEAGMSTASNLARLIRHTERAGSKIVLSGEDKQLDAIVHGGGLKFMSRDDIAGTARIETIVRQREQWARDAAMNYRDGKMAEGLKAFQDRGLVNVVRDGMEKTQDRLVADWYEYATANPEKQSLILAHSNVNAREIGDQVRQLRKEDGTVTGAEHVLQCGHGTKADGKKEDAYELTLSQGDRIRFGKNDEKGVGAINGTLGTVRSIRSIQSDDGTPDYALVVDTDDRGRVAFKASDYVNDQGKTELAQAYVMTIYSSQGMTIDGDTFVLQTAGMGRRETYVANSRAKDATRTYINGDGFAGTKGRGSDADVIGRVVKNMSVDQDKSLALDHMLRIEPDYLSRHAPQPSDREESERKAAAETERVRVADEIKAAKAKAVVTERSAQDIELIRQRRAMDAAQYLAVREAPKAVPVAVAAEKDVSKPWLRERAKDRTAEVAQAWAERQAKPTPALATATEQQAEPIAPRHAGESLAEMRSRIAGPTMNNDERMVVVEKAKQKQEDVAQDADVTWYVNEAERQIDEVAPDLPKEGPIEEVDEPSWDMYQISEADEQLAQRMVEAQRQPPPEPEQDQGMTMGG